MRSSSPRSCHNPHPPPPWLAKGLSAIRAQPRRKAMRGQRHDGDGPSDGHETRWYGESITLHRAKSQEANRGARQHVPKWHPHNDAPAKADDADRRRFPIASKREQTRAYRGFEPARCRRRSRDECAEIGRSVPSSGNLTASALIQVKALASLPAVTPSGCSRPSPAFLLNPST